MPRFIAFALLAFGLCLAANVRAVSGQEGPPQYQATPVTHPDFQIFLTDLNNNGQAVGEARGDSPEEEFAVFINSINSTDKILEEAIERMRTLIPDGPASALGINDQGISVGSADAADGKIHAVQWPNSQSPPQDLGIFGAQGAAAVAINNSGDKAVITERQNGTTGTILVPGTGFGSLALGPDPRFVSSVPRAISQRADAESLPKVVGELVNTTGTSMPFVGSPPESPRVLCLLSGHTFGGATSIAQVTMGDTVQEIITGFSGNSSETRPVMWKNGALQPEPLPCRRASPPRFLKA